MRLNVEGGMLVLKISPKIQVFRAVFIYEVENPPNFVLLHQCVIKCQKDFKIPTFKNKISFPVLKITFLDLIGG